jgi:hypothetical protein
MYRPWIGRKFGVEMEMNDVSVERVAITERALRGAIVDGVTSIGGHANRVSDRAAGYYHSSGQTWDVKTDASCGYNGRTGWEVASPAMLMDDEGECEELRAVARKLSGLRPRIDRSCGLHVHVEVRDFDWKDLRNLMVLWSRYEPFAFELCPPSRRTNHFCPPFRKTEWAGQNGGYWTRIEPTFNATNEAEFRRVLAGATPRGSLNIAHFWTGKRVEFRLGAGTVNYEKIARWVQFLLSFVQRVKQTQMPMIQTGAWSDRGFSTGYVFKMLGLAPSVYVPASEIPEASRNLMVWVEERRRQFSRPDGDAVEQAVSAGAYADAGRRV